MISACALVTLLFVAKPRDDRFSKYKSVAAYEVLQGILVLPRYASDGQICEAAIQANHYSENVMRFDSTMPRDTVDQIVNELVPDSEKGPLLEDKDLARLEIYAGHSVTSFMDYKNVSIDISRGDTDHGEIVAVIKWKHAACK
jgi:hypothetical protein